MIVQHAFSSRRCVACQKTVALSKHLHQIIQATLYYNAGTLLRQLGLALA
jgi:hypothetical protein